MLWSTPIGPAARPVLLVCGWWPAPRCNLRMRIPQYVDGRYTIGGVTFYYTIATLATLAAADVEIAAVDWATAPERRQVRRWLDERTLLVVARDQAGDLLAVVAIEDDDGQRMLICSARYLTDTDTTEGVTP